MIYTSNRAKRTDTKFGEKDKIFFLLALLLGVLVRLALLQEAAFTGSELNLANQALLISRGTAAISSNAPAYSGITALLFWIFEPSNFLARLLPLLFGLSLIPLPVIWVDQLGRKTSLFLTVAIALSPVMVVFSRAVNPGVFALAGILWALSFLRLRKPGLAGLSLAIAFLSGAAFWIFLFSIFALFVIIRIFMGKEVIQSLLIFIQPKQFFSSASVVVFMITIALTSTTFFLNPSGLGGAASGLIGFVEQYRTPYEKPLYHSLYLMLAHSLLPGILFLLGLVKEKAFFWRKILSVLGIASILSLVFATFFTRQSFEIFLLIELFLLIGASRYLSSYKIPKPLQFHHLAVMVFVAAILSYISQKLGQLSKLALNSPQFLSLGLMALAGIILLVSVWWLVRFAWHGGDVNNIILLTGIGFLFVLSLSSVFRGISIDQNLRSNEYLGSSVYFPNRDIDLTLDEFNLEGKNLGILGSYQIKELPEHLGWYLNDFSALSPEGKATLILTRNTEFPDSQDEYRGRNLILERSVNWTHNGIQTYLQMLLGSQPNFLDQKAVLWIRTNLFTGANQ